VNSNNLNSYLKQRQRSFWDTWMDCTKGLRPLGNVRWRNGNRSFNQESLSLLGYLSTERVRPSVIYADPPYTDDQYSRYYHVWETLVAYDYPRAEGEGRYRPDRFHTPFSRKSEVVWSVTELVRRTAALEADLVLSYPANGLLQSAGADPHDLLCQSFCKVKIAVQRSYTHSTMGGSKGVARHPVTEQVYFASNS
jgi:adenine-specific DNA-methyltransferase